MAKDTKAQAEAGGQTRPNVRAVPNPAPIEELFADGVGSLMSRGGVVKLDLFRVVGYERDSKAELRQVSHRLVLPLSAVPDMVKIFNSVARAAQQASAQSGSGGDGGAPTPVSDPMV
jgi:hypothetical protein